MNQDFALLATPANARRLLRFQQVCAMVVSDDIVALAEQDRIDQRAFDPMVCPGDPVRHEMMQFLLDCNLRAVVQADYHPEITPLTVLNIVRMAAPEHIVIVTERRKPWALASLALGLTMVRYMKTLATIDECDRQTVVIYDASYMTCIVHGLRNIVREFPRFIIFEDRRGFDQLIHWSVWAGLLFPTMPHPLYPRLATDVPEGWDKLPLVAFAPFYNVCIIPHLITAPAIRAALQDQYAITRLTVRFDGSALSLWCWLDR